MTVVQSPEDVASYFLSQVEMALADCDREPVNRAYVAAGQIAWDDCCGMLVVAPERIYKSATFPTQNADEELCWGGYLTIDLLVLLVRCVPVLDDRGRAPSASALSTAYQRLIDDGAVVYNAVTAALPDREWMRALPTQTYSGAEGGCIAVETRFTIGIPQNEWALCCAESVPWVPGEPICHMPADFVRFDPCAPLTSTNVQDAICETVALIPTTAAEVPFVPCEDITSTNVQDAICEVASTVPVITGPQPFTVNGGTIGGTQPTFSGPPMFTGQVMTIGDFVHFEIQVEFDNITSFGTGQYFVDLPFIPGHPIMLRNGCLHDASTGRQYSIAGHAVAGNVQMALWYIGSNGHDEMFDHNSPVNLQTVDSFHIAGEYVRQ